MSLLISAKILEIILYVLGFTPRILLQNIQNLWKKICNFRYRFACFVYSIASHLTVQCTIWRGENGTYRKNLRKVDYKDNLGCVYHHSKDLKPCSGKQGSPLPWSLFFVDCIYQGWAKFSVKEPRAEMQNYERATNSVWSVNTKTTKQVLQRRKQVLLKTI